MLELLYSSPKYMYMVKVCQFRYSILWEFLFLLFMVFASIVNPNKYETGNRYATTSQYIR